MKARTVQLSSTIIIAFVTLVLGIFVGANWDNWAEQFGPYLGGQKASSVNFDSLEGLYRQLTANFDGDIDPTTAIEEAKRGLVNAAGDRYTYYLTSEEAVEFNKDLNGEIGAGVGIEMAERDGWVKILRTTPDNPAREAGVLAGDIIYKVNGEVVTDLSAEEIANLVRGEAGTSVDLTVVRDNEEITFTLVREEINNVSAYIDYRDDVAILTISRFDEKTGELVSQLAQEAVDRSVSKIILDLRGNGGGYVDAAKAVLSLWIDGQLIVEQKSADGTYDEKVYADRGKAILADIPTIVLTNAATASSSEIVAGALQDYGLATIMGETSFGKGSVQSLINLDDGALLRVTIAKWYTPNGQNINGDGIEPDVVVERSYDQINHDIDPQLDAALEYWYTIKYENKEVHGSARSSIRGKIRHLSVGK